MSLSKVKQLYEAKRSEVNAIADADYPAFLKWFATNKPELYAKTLEANAKRKMPKKLLIQVMHLYLKWKAEGGK